MQLLQSLLRPRGQLGRVRVRLSQPDFAVLKIIEEGANVSAGNLVSPDDFRVINVGAVVNSGIEICLEDSLTFRDSRPGMNTSMTASAQCDQI